MIEFCLGFIIGVFFGATIICCVVAGKDNRND